MGRGVPQAPPRSKERAPGTGKPRHGVEKEERRRVMWREKERKRRGSATLRTNGRSEFCVDRDADGFLTRAVLARVLRTYLGSHRRPRR